MAVVKYLNEAAPFDAGNGVTRRVLSYTEDMMVVQVAFATGGVGTALYNAVIEYAKQCGCYNVTLNVWTCNPSAQAFYESLGMKQQRITMETIL